MKRRFINRRARLTLPLVTALSPLGGLLTLARPGSGRTGSSGGSVTAAESSYDGLSLRLQGCDLDVADTLPNGGGKFICPDGSGADPK
jgi:hypothetical protein